MDRPQTRRRWIPGRQTLNERSLEQDDLDERDAVDESTKRSEGVAFDVHYGWLDLRTSLTEDDRRA